MAAAQIWVLLPVVPDLGGPSQSKATALPTFCWRRRTYLLLWLVLPQSSGHPSAAVSRLTCGWKSCRRKREARRQVSETTKTQERYQGPNVVPLWRKQWRNYLAVLFLRHTVIVLLSSPQVLVNQRR